MIHHSEMIDKLKRIKETLDDTYTTPQLLDTLDSLVYQSIDRIIDHTNFLDQLFPFILSWYASENRRKISAVSKPEFYKFVMVYLAANTPSVKKKIFRLMEIERNSILALVNHFIQITKFSSTAHAQYLTTHTSQPKKAFMMQSQCLEMSSGFMLDGYDVYNLRRDIFFWHNQAQKFKSAIVEKYIRHAINYATVYIKSNSSTHSIDINDLVQDLVYAADTAVSKCSKTKGALTSYITQWFRSAVTTGTSHEYNIAYSIPPQIKQSIAKGISYQNNLTHSLDDSGLDIETTEDTPCDVVEKSEQIEYIRMLTRLADPKGYLRLSIGIKNILTEDEKAILLKCK